MSYPTNLTPAEIAAVLQASMWHEKYKDAMRHEDDAKRYREALLRIKDGYGITKERLRLIVTRALEPVGAQSNQPTEKTK